MLGENLLTTSHASKIVFSTGDHNGVVAAKFWCHMLVNIKKTTAVRRKAANASIFREAKASKNQTNSSYLNAKIFTQSKNSLNSTKQPVALTLLVTKLHHQCIAYELSFILQGKITPMQSI